MSRMDHTLSVAEMVSSEKENEKSVYDIDSQEEVSPPRPLSRPSFKDNKGYNIPSASAETQKHNAQKSDGEGKDMFGNKKDLEMKNLACSENDSGRNLAGDTSADVVYIYSPELVGISSQMLKIQGRAHMVHSLISAYGLLNHLKVIPPRHASESEILSFHSEEYVKFLHKVSQTDDDEKFEDEANHFGLTYDCPVHEGLYEYGALTGGATLTAAEYLTRGHCLTAINWCGGWHHAKKDQASGFCYVNDIVLGILKLRETFSKVLYVDLDVHHGDGVEEAFCASNKVMTVSIHKHAAGFFPGTGSVSDIGIGKAKYFTVNIPLQDGIKDAQFVPLICRVLQRVKEVFCPDAVVCQCGADGLSQDPMDSFNLTHQGLGKPLYYILSWKLPTLVLGGGGYNHTNTARCWTYLTSIATKHKISTEIPDHKYFMDYGPDFELDVMQGNRKDHNSREYLQWVYGKVMSNLGKIS